MKEFFTHTLEELKRLAQRRGREFDPAREIAVCRRCGMPSGLMGIVHWDDCDALQDSDIKFRPYR